MTTQQIEELARQVKTLPAQQQREVADFVAFLKTRTRPRGTPGHMLRPLKDTLSDEEARQMMADIEEGCGQIDWEGWK